MDPTPTELHDTSTGGLSTAFKLEHPGTEARLCVSIGLLISVNYLNFLCQKLLRLAPRTWPAAKTSWISWGGNLPGHKNCNAICTLQWQQQQEADPICGCGRIQEPSSGLASFCKCLRIPAPVASCNQRTSRGIISTMIF